MAENREDERAVSGEDSLLDGGFTWLRETVPLKETPPAPRAAGAAPGSPAGEPAVSAEEEAALYLFGGPEEGDGNTGTPVKQKAAGSGGDPDAPATEAAEEPDVFAGVRDAEPAGAAASPDSDPAPDLALEGDPGEADQDIAEEENEGSAAVAALGRLLGSRQDVPYSEKENVHYYNNINKSGPEDGAFPEGKKRRSPSRRRKKTMMETLKTRKRKAGAGAPEDPPSAAGSVSPLSPSSFPELPPGTPRDREAGTAGPGFPPRRPRLSSSADRPAPCALCLRRKMAAEGRCLLLEQLTGTRPRRRRRFFLPRLKAAQRRQRPLPVPQPRSVRP